MVLCSTDCASAHGHPAFTHVGDKQRTRRVSVRPAHAEPGNRLLSVRGPSAVGARQGPQWPPEAKRKVARLMEADVKREDGLSYVPGCNREMVVTNH